MIFLGGISWRLFTGCLLESKCVEMGMQLWWSTCLVLEKFSFQSAVSKERKQKKVDITICKCCFVPVTSKDHNCRILSRPKWKTRCFKLFEMRQGYFQILKTSFEIIIMWPHIRGVVYSKVSNVYYILLNMRLLQSGMKNNRVHEARCFIEIFLWFRTCLENCLC